MVFTVPRIANELDTVLNGTLDYYGSAWRQHQIGFILSFGSQTAVMNSKPTKEYLELVQTNSEN